MEVNFAAITIQKAWRGFRIRRGFEEVQQHYYDLAANIDGSDMYHKLPKLCRMPEGTQVLKRPGLIYTDPFHKSDRTELFQQSADFSINGSENSVETINKGSVEESHDFHVSYNESVCAQSTTSLSQKQLLNKKRDVTMELLWVQQAIESRRNYLNVKKQLAI
uniref:Uncharacterized protein LOC100180192 n=1 Tax=Phallusia mammillata TaxID=59560 RepID=A0A6F9DHW8_9ASCI|nr:uncharacterized protein LOC100180192 [Phallusia mammillata]